MNAFVPKRIYPKESWGEKLRQARLAKNIRLEEASRRLHIRQEYLVCLEEERLEQLPAGLYGKNFFREYASFLGIKDKEMLSAIEAKLSANKDTDPFSQKVISQKQFLVLPKIFRNLIAVLAIVFCLLYLSFYFKKIISPPELEISSPAGNLATSSLTFIIEGQTDKEAEVRINGELVLNNHDGIFTQIVNLKRGMNEITITSKKKYSREKIINRQILVN